MSESTDASTSEHAPPAANTSIRRSFTEPTRIANRPKPPTPRRESADGIETLFTHSPAKIVSFTSPSGHSRLSTASRRLSVETKGDAPTPAPWKSSTERTLAVGVLRIYRVTASNVSFLNSGTLLHTIFPKSQCWCVDGDSKFVLRIRQDSYYRIELPYGSDEDKEKIGEFKTVLDNVLQYEKTLCPFTRGFEVELPEQPQTPIRKRQRKPAEKAKRWLFDKTWVPEDSPRSLLEDSDSGTASPYDDDDRSSIHTTSAANETPEHEKLSTSVPRETPPQPLKAPTVPERVKAFQSMRSFTSPLPVDPKSSSTMSRISATSEEIMNPSTTASEPQADQNQSSTSHYADTVSLMSSADSFYSLDQDISRAPTPPYLDAPTSIEDNPWIKEQGTESNEEHKDADPLQGDDSTRGRSSHRRQISEVTITPHTVEALEATPYTPTISVQPSSAPSTPPLDTDSDDSLEPPFLDVPTPPDTIRLRKLTGASQRRAFSPMPHPQNLFCPPAPSVRKQFTNALVRKTCEIILGPPAHLVSLMLRIAARVSQGMFGFDTYRVRSPGERIPCSWESDEDDWDEDDYGIPLNNLEAPTLRKRGQNGALEVD